MVRLSILLLVASLCLFCPAWTRADESAGEEISEHLAAGEFAPAFQIARETKDQGLRDRQFQEIAIAQASALGRAGSLNSLAEIGDDRTRADAVEAVRDARGGGPVADFDPLIDLIRSTVAPTTWDDVGGPGSIQEFAGAGVYVDAKGLLSKIDQPRGSKRLISLRNKPLSVLNNQDPVPKGDSRRSSALRYVSLTRLEKEIQLLRAADQQPTDAMRALAGLQRIQYVLVYPETGDLVVAGPAGDWRTDRLGRTVGVDTQRPVVLLDDLVVITRHLAKNGQATFGCTIDPREANLKRTQQYLAAHSDKPLTALTRKKWLRGIRSAMGKQDIKVFGLDPETHAARVLVAADYHMKLVGMGLEKGAPGMEGYLDSIRVKQGEAPPPMDVLRWWFTLNYQAIHATPDRLAFEIRGTGVKVLSENQLLGEQGRRVPTGRSDELNQLFANRFTQNFDELARMYPIYAELQNLCDLALVGALIESHRLDEKVGWNRTEFGDPDLFQVAQGVAPTEVETVINHRRVNGRFTIAGVSGGVSVNPWALVKPGAIENVADNYHLQSARGERTPTPEARGPWWWD